ncbi:MAG: hypothetical protein DMF14_15150 [Verrucomicrobia bacterium]|nr:MAG: hypothetical protein DMF14_15150 [Verrucomicrobiota bacterium]
MATELRVGGGTIQFNSATELRHGIANLLRDPGLRQKLVRNARETLDQHRDATTPTAALINELV